VGAQLVRRVLEGEDTAWEELLKALTPVVSRVVCAHLRRNSDREDVVQEVLTRVFLHIRSFRQSGSMESWVSRIAINTCHDWLRKMKARPAINWTDLDASEADMLLRSFSGHLPNVEEDRTALFELLDKLIATLKPREQIVIRLLDLEDRSVQDVSKLTGWGASKVKVTAMRARRKLAAQFERLGEAPPPRHPKP
jgi:RNA polymerase sigma factor (sigma-70 family)